MVRILSIILFGCCACKTIDFSKIDPSKYYAGDIIEFRVYHADTISSLEKPFLLKCSFKNISNDTLMFNPTGYYFVNEILDYSLYDSALQYFIPKNDNFITLYPNTIYEHSISLQRSEFIVNRRNSFYGDYIFEIRYDTDSLIIHTWNKDIIRRAIVYEKIPFSIDKDHKD